MARPGNRSLSVIDLHAAGEPARVVVGGLPHVPGATMFEKRAFLMAHHDGLRKLLLQEPRGYPCQNVDYILPPTVPEAAFGFVIAEQHAIYPLMSGHNTICVATALLETGMVPMEEPETEFVLEPPAGPIRLRARCRDGKVESVTFRNVPAFVRHLGVPVTVPTLPEPVRVDVAFGGMWYVIVEAAQLGLELHPRHGKALCRLGEMLKAACREQHPVQHPLLDYPGPDILVLRGPPEAAGATARNAVVMSNGALDWQRPETWAAMLDRSPCGSGTCAVMAAEHARGQLSLNHDFVHESILGTTFIGRLVEKTQVGEYDAVIPEVTGSAWITTIAQVLLHKSDPFPEGFTVGDIWS
eukprot:TRINITY_DN9499_c0_g1_i2.p1 TRINITY_DN9499_c0_g1~~TRINITY_DN9499_c0_g1_i2.p1  ORF type:complete len:368 (+),score=104.90 TRINITY_DN9499_c0_g1_i2:40-1104(+)